MITKWEEEEMSRCKTLLIREGAKKQSCKGANKKVTKFYDILI